MSTRWRREGRGLDLAVELAANTAGIVRLPIGGLGSPVVTESGVAVWKDGRNAGTVEGLEPPRAEGDWLVIPIGSGSYRFAVAG